MNKIRVIIFSFMIVMGGPSLQASTMHHDFVDVSNAVSGIIVEPRYATSNNFIGRPVDGYNAPKVMVSRGVAAALNKVQQELAGMGLSLKIYDGYRPQRAVDHFMRWIKDTEDQKNKQQYYPDIDKAMLVERGYIAEKSGHSRGGSVDITLVKHANGRPEALDMGSPWDLFDPVSHADADGISAAAQANRCLLRETMVRHGFRPYSEEWWHFTLDPEPHPNTYFDFPVE